MDTQNDNLLPPDAQDTAASLAAALAPPAAPGHFDELRGAVAPNAPFSIASSAGVASAWGTFFENLGRDGFQDLDRRMQSLQRQVRDNGITYNVYADADGPQRPWSVDLFPLILSQGD